MCWEESISTLISEFFKPRHQPGRCERGFHRDNQLVLGILPPHLCNGRCNVAHGCGEVFLTGLPLPCEFKPLPLRFSNKVPRVLSSLPTSCFVAAGLKFSSCAAR